MKTTLTSLVLVLAATTIGCAGDLEEEFATAAVTSSLATTRDQNGSREVVRSVANCDFTAEEAVKKAADEPVVGFFPSTCVTKDADGDDLHVRYDGCTGVFGKADISGGLDAHIAVTGECQVTADILDAGDLTNHGERFEYSASAEVTIGDGERDVDWRASWSGLTKDGRTIEQTSDFRALVDTASNCRDLEGTASGIIDGDYPYEIAVSDFTMCPDACPSRGTVVASWEGRRKDREVTIQFDGSSTATVTGWSGREYAVDMVCGDASAGDASAAE